MSSTERASRSELRNFGLIVAGGFLLIGWRPLHAPHALPAHRLWAFVLGAALAALAAAAPGLLRWPHRIWTRLGTWLGTANSYLICTILFYFVITPFGIILRLAGKDSLCLKGDRGRASYAEVSKKRDLEHFKFQF